MKKHIYIFFLLLSVIVYSQDDISTKFIESGSLRATIDINSQKTVQFKRNQKCLVLEYSGQNTYKVKLDESDGYVGDEFLDITEEMMDLFYDYEEREMEKLIAQEESRKQQIQNILEQKQNKFKDSIAKIEEARQLKELETQRLEELSKQRKQDSLAKVEEEKLLIQKEQERKRIEKLALQRKQDSIAAAREEAQRLIQLENEKERQRLKEKDLARKKDSIDSIREVQKGQIELEKQRERQRLQDIAEKRKQDSIANVKAEAARLSMLKQQEVLKQKAASLLLKRKQDSLAKIQKETEKFEALQRQKEQKQKEALAQKKVQDSIAKLKATQAFIAQQRQRELKRLETLNLKRQQDSIAKVKKEQLRALALQKKEERKRLEKVNNQKQQETIPKSDAASEARLRVIQLQERLTTQKVLEGEIKQDSLTTVAARLNRYIEIKREKERKRVAAFKAKVKQDSIGNAKAAAAGFLVVRQDEKLKQMKVVEVKKQRDFNANMQKLETRLEGLKRAIWRLRKDTAEARLKQDSLTTLRTQLEKLLPVKKSNNPISEKIIAKKENKTDVLKTLKGNTQNKPSSDKSKLTITDELRNTCHFKINTFDKYYNIKTIQTEAYPVANTLMVELYKQGHNTSVYFSTTKDLGCATQLANNRSSVKVTLKNNKTLTFFHAWGDECNKFVLKSNITEDEISNLLKSPIKSLVLKGTKGTHEILNVEYQTFFIDKLKCIE